MDPVAAFVLGGIFTALVGIATTEFAAWQASRRETRRSLREARLAALHKTMAWVAAYSRYALYSWVDVSREWDPVPYSDARPGLVGDPETLEALYDALNAVFRADRETSPPSIEDIEAVAAAVERVHRCLAEQVDRVASGGDPTVIPEHVVAQITSETALVEGWWQGFGLKRRLAVNDDSSSVPS